MNADAMLQYGHKTLMRALERVDSQHVDVPGACGTWSVKDILAHLSSYEMMFVESLRQILGEQETPLLNELFAQGRNFNDEQVRTRRNKTYDEILSEYQEAHTQSLELLNQIPIEKRRQNGVVAWYGEEYDLEDFLVYTIYAHKREHAGHIDIFDDRMREAT